eukprot:TRINITY_DN137_c1_g1_i2.p1 TRINITY_DN137_c1_g1~~TRINITY_DN137_c1_g1_i2.p1  ORF type:complete len:112 (+),score=2.21 TRINITY_DN137_c1_g1_i2:265-600(+)
MLPWIHHRGVGELFHSPSLLCTMRRPVATHKPFGLLLHQQPLERNGITKKKERKLQKRNKLSQPITHPILYPIPADKSKIRAKNNERVLEAKLVPGKDDAAETEHVSSSLP